MVTKFCCKPLTKPIALFNSQGLPGLEGAICLYALSIKHRKINSTFKILLHKVTTNRRFYRKKVVGLYVLIDWLQMQLTTKRCHNDNSENHMFVYRQAQHVIMPIICCTYFAVYKLAGGQKIKRSSRAFGLTPILQSLGA